MASFWNQLKVALALIALGAFYSTSFAQGKTLSWTCKFDTGECIGKVKLLVKKAPREDAIGHYVLSSFPNGEYLFEDFSDRKMKKIFHLADKYYLFFGANGQEEADALKERYQHKFGRVLFAVMITLVGAFPEGENKFPHEWQTRKLDSEGQPLDVSGKRAGYKKFLFKVKNYEWDVEGEWDVTKPAPWPDSEPMAGWTMSGDSPSPTLGLARKFTQH